MWGPNFVAEMCNEQIVKILAAIIMIGAIIGGIIVAAVFTLVQL